MILEFLAESLEWALAAPRRTTMRRILVAVIVAAMAVVVALAIASDS